jgi:histone H3/H4
LRHGVGQRAQFQRLWRKASRARSSSGASGAWRGVAVEAFEVMKIF